MKNSSGKFVIIVREPGFLRSLFYFLDKSFSKDVLVCTYGFQEIPGVHVFPYNSSQEEIFSFLQQNQCKSVLFLSNQAGLLPDSVMATSFTNKGILAKAQSMEAAKLGSDKIAMKHFFKKEALPTSNYEIVRNLKEALDASAKLMFPVLLKAANLSDGRKLGCIRNLQDIETYFYENAVDSPVIMEEFIEGTEVSVIVYANFGNPVVFPVVVKPNTNYLLNKQEMLRKRLYVMADGILDTQLETEVKNMALQLSKKINNQLLVGLDIVLGKKGPYIMEFNARVTETLRMSMLGADTNIIRSLIAGKPLNIQSSFLESKGITLDIPHDLNSTEIIDTVGKSPDAKIETDTRCTYHFMQEALPNDFISQYL